MRASELKPIFKWDPDFSTIDPQIVEWFKTLIDHEPFPNDLPLEQGRELLKGLPRPQQAQTWELYRNRCQLRKECIAGAAKTIEDVFNTLPVIVGVLVSAETVEDIALWYDAYDIPNNPKLQKKVWRSMTPDQQDRVLPLIKAYKEQTEK